MQLPGDAVSTRPRTGHRRYDTPRDAEVGPVPPVAKPLLDPKLTTVLGRATGMKTQEMNAIAAQVKENWTKLNGCAKHDFIVDERVPYQPLRERYVCRTCGGTIDGSAFHWWKRGMKDAHA